VVWATGWVGSLAIRAVHRRADLELVGVWVHSEEKDGRDAGELAGLDPIGVSASRDSEALLALAPECICYTASGPERDAAAIPDYVVMLERGINVVTVSSPGLVFPPAFAAPAREQLDDAAKRGSASLYASGIEPGFAGDQLALTLLTQCDTVRSIRTQELFRYDTYPVTFMMFDVFGFGRPLEYTPLMSSEGAQSGTWGPPVQMVAHALGVELDTIRETYDRRVTGRTLEVAAGVIEAGTVGAIRMETIGVVDGRDAIVIEHVNRMADDVAPDWPQSARDGTYRIVVDGNPSLQCEMTVGTEITASADGMVATAMRCVNAIPFVVDAPPGLVSSLDLPLTLPRFAFS
jgi:hypothetical protein